MCFNLFALSECLCHAVDDKYLLALLYISIIITVARNWRWSYRVLLLKFSTLPISVLSTDIRYFLFFCCRPWFFSFVFCMFILVLLTDFFCYWLLSEFGFDWAVVIGAVEAGVASVAVTAVTCLMVRLALFYMNTRRDKNQTQ